MIFASNILSQNSFEPGGYWGNLNSSGNLLNSFESNPSNYSLLKDWGVTLSYGAEMGNSTTSTLYLLSLSKKINGSTISLRYTPGYQKEFIFTNSESIFINDSSSQSLSSNYTYKELFGLGYSYKFSDKFSTGFTFRFFNQEFNKESAVVVFSDTIHFEKNNNTKKYNLWRLDIGVNYTPFQNLSLSLSSNNLLDFSENIDDPEFNNFKLRETKSAIIGLSYAFIKSVSLNALYETSNSFQLSCSGFFNIFSDQIGISLTAFHDKYQTPYMAGIIPSIVYNSKLFSVSLSMLKYFSDRKSTQDFSSFENEGLTNIVNNRYSYDKAMLKVAFKLNTIKEKSVELIDVKILDNIFPTLTQNYLDHPFAVGKAVNLTNRRITIKPMSKIEGLNKDLIQSKSISIAPCDTAEVNFFTIVPDDYAKKKVEISYADFYVIESEENPEDKFQKPILVNSVNAWDGKVINLKYFIKKDVNFSMTYAKQILSEHKAELDTLNYAYASFYKAKLIFNSIVKNIVYTSDPRASAEYVQFPHQTLELKGGDCDDLSVLFSSLLESVGIETALVDYQTGTGIRHVNVLVNTELSPEQARLITKNDSKYIIRKNDSGEDRVWIPIETTSLTNFEKAWEIGLKSLILMRLIIMVWLKVMFK